MPDIGNSSLTKHPERRGLYVLDKEQLAHRGFQDFPAVYSALKMTNDSFKFYFHILLALKFKIIAVVQILLPLKSQTTVIIQILRALKCESKI